MNVMVYMEDDGEVHFEIYGSQETVAFNINSTWEGESINLTRDQALAAAHAIIAHFTKDQPK
jgi:hypothetical protein